MAIVLLVSPLNPAVVVPSAVDVPDDVDIFVSTAPTAVLVTFVAADV